MPVNTVLGQDPPAGVKEPEGSTVTLTDLAAALSGVGLVLPNATLQASPANPTATTSTTGVMMGLGSSCKITPAYSGRVRFEINGSSQSNGANTVSTLGKFGTGAAPTNGTAATGTSLGATRQNTSAANGNLLAFTINGIATGLTAGTQYWFDVDVLGSAGTSTVQNIDCNAMEF